MLKFIGAALLLALIFGVFLSRQSSQRVSRRMARQSRANANAEYMRQRADWYRANPWALDKQSEVLWPPSAAPGCCGQLPPPRPGSYGQLPPPRPGGYGQPPFLPPPRPPV